MKFVDMSVHKITEADLNIIDYSLKDEIQDLIDNFGNLKSLVPNDNKNAYFKE